MWVRVCVGAGCVGAGVCVCVCVRVFVGAGLCLLAACPMKGLRRPSTSGTIHLRYEKQGSRLILDLPVVGGVLSGCRLERR